MALSVATTGNAVIDDAQALTNLYVKTGRAAIAKTAALVGSQQVAEELVQEVFSRLWHARLSFESEKAGFLWIYRSCHRAGIDYLRSGRYRYEASDECGNFEAFGGDAETVLHNRRLLISCLGALDAQESEVLAYLYIDGMTQNEVASLLGLSRKTVQRIAIRIDAKMERIKRSDR